jgi:hypothetical protein
MKNLFSIIFTVLLFLVFTGCGIDKSAAGAEKETGSVQFAFTFNGCSSSVVDEISVIVITMTKDSKVIHEYVTLNNGTATKQINGLVSGTWDLNVDALDADNKIILSGSASVVIESGKVSCAKIKLKPNTGGVVITIEIEDETGALVFWSTMGSPVEILFPKIGPSGKISGGGFSEGKFGSAFIADYTQAYCVRFPYQIIPESRGCIEFWAKLDGFDNDEIIPWGENPVLCYLGDEIGQCQYSLRFNGNDGRSAGGLSGFAGDKNFGTNFYYDNVTYGNILGDVNIWHHYALSWDNDGVPGYPYVMQIFLDGNPVGQPIDPHDVPFNKPQSGEFKIIDNWMGKGTVTIDNLKIYNYAKTDFSDRETE